MINQMKDLSQRKAATADKIIASVILFRSGICSFVLSGN